MYSRMIILHQSLQLWFARWKVNHSKPRKPPWQSSQTLGETCMQSSPTSNWSPAKRKKFSRMKTAELLTKKDDAFGVSKWCRLWQKSVVKCDFETSFGGKVSEKNIGKTTCVLSMEHCNISAIFEHVAVKCSFHVIFRGRWLFAKHAAHLLKLTNENHKHS